MKNLILIGLLACSMAWSARIKDVAGLDGVGEAQLVGYGLVVGLAGTGDGTRTQFTIQSVANMLQKMGIEVPAEKLRLRNVAAVMVTADLQAFVKPGKRMDVALSSLGDARSLAGGTLLMTPLQAADGEVYALAQGPVSVGGSVNFDSRNRQRYAKNHTLSGNIPDGALVQRQIAHADLNGGVLRWVLNVPDFSSAVAMAAAINRTAPGSAVAEDAGTVRVNVPKEKQADLMAFIAQTEVQEFTTSNSAKVVLNEKTGTLVAGADVRIDQVAVSHGSVVININDQEQVSQPAPLSQGRTATVQQEQVQVEEKVPEVKVLPQVTNAGELAQALNSLGVSPRDIISIFQAIKKAGALQAELVIM